MFNQQPQGFIHLPSAIFNIHIYLLLNVKGAFHLLSLTDFTTPDVSQSIKPRGKDSTNDVRHKRRRKKRGDKTMGQRTLFEMTIPPA